MEFSSQRRLEYKENQAKYRKMTRKPRSHVRILKYRTWAISAPKLLCTKFADPGYSGFLFSNQPIKIIDLKVTKKNCKTG